MIVRKEADACPAGFPGPPGWIVDLEERRGAIHISDNDR